MPTPTAGPLFYSTAEVAVKLHLSENTVRKLCRAGTVPGVRVGPWLWRIPKDQFHAYVAGLLAARPVPAGVP